MDWTELDKQLQQLACPGREIIVPARGNRTAELVLVGEAPGRQEEEQRTPFIGAAGKLLSKAILDAGLVESELYITNSIKWRPPNNRQPLDNELDEAKTVLFNELDLIKPRVVLALGATAFRALTGIWRIPSDAKQYCTPVKLTNITLSVLTTWHPAYLLRQPQKKSELVNDLKAAWRRVEAYRDDSYRLNPEYWD